MADLFHRVSIRKYQEKKVEPEKLDYILRASMAAPSACNQQPWEFYIVEDPEILEELSETTPYAKLTAKAPVATGWKKWKKLSVFRKVSGPSVSLHWDIRQKREPSRIVMMKPGSIV